MKYAIIVKNIKSNAKYLNFEEKAWFDKLNLSNQPKLYDNIEDVEKVLYTKVMLGVQSEIVTQKKSLFGCERSFDSVRTTKGREKWKARIDQCKDRLDFLRSLSQNSFEIVEVPE